MKPVAIVGAGPYALATASFLRRRGVEAQLFGEVMGFWRSMPSGMFLRSYYRASSIADPDGSLSLAAFEAVRGCELERPIPLADFIAYGDWFAAQAGIEVDRRRVALVSRRNGAFRLALEDGTEVESRRVVVAAGVTPFSWRPPLFERLDRELVTHTSEHREYGQFRDRRVAVVGAGQSALEAAAFLHEAGASVELLVRQPALRYLRGERLSEGAGAIGNLVYPSWGVGPPGLNWIMGLPSLYRLLPRRIGEPLARRAIRPAGASWLRPRLAGVTLTTGRTVRAARTEGGRVELQLDDGSTRTVDHLVLGTGYRIDVRRYGFLDPELVARLRLVGTYPRLAPSFQSSVPGLYFVGAPAAASAGPGMRFVSHTGFVARAIARDVGAGL